MVDCRPAAGAPPPELVTNGAPPTDAQHNQVNTSGDMGGMSGLTSPASVRASTPATTNTISTFTGGMNPGVGGPYGGGGVGVGGVPCAPYVCGVKSVVWCAPHSPPPPHHAPPHPPHGVNPHVYKSMQANGADLPMNDIPTLRYYFNLGVECMWAAYGPPPAHVPPRHYSPRDLAQDMQQISIHDRPPMNHNGGDNNKHKAAGPNDKPPLNQNKGNGQRPLLGPRFKRGNNQEGNQNANHNQNKGHNNLNKGPNNRRNSHPEGRGPPHYGPPEGECMMEQPLISLPYIPYPPPIYPIQYYPVESDPAMMGMMGGMGYVGYDEGVEYGPVQQFYPPPPYPPPPHHPHLPPPPPPAAVASHQHQVEHK